MNIEELSVDEIRTYLEKFFKEREYEGFLVESGQKELSDFKLITENYAWLFSKEILEIIDRSIEESEDENYSRSQLLRKFFLQSMVESKCNTFYDQLMNGELHSRVRLNNGEEMSYRQACSQQRYEKYLNLESSSEGFAFFFEDFLKSKTWLQKYIDFSNESEVNSYLEFSLFLNLFNMRSTIANFQYEIMFHGGNDFADKAEMCHDIFSNALKIPYPHELFFEIVDPVFNSVHYLLGGLPSSLFYN
ncbi:hypothetical protein JXQ70_14570 [bacterium]|nr:hypothetical protein [bacterium]